MHLAIDTTTSASEDQRGINMVDLMMWLVIAALLLAAALQGIGFYQRAAWTNNLKSDTGNVRQYMEGYRATNSVYPTESQLVAAATSGDLRLSKGNSIHGYLMQDNGEDWVVRVCSYNLHIATGNAVGSAIRVNRADPTVLQMAQCG